MNDIHTDNKADTTNPPQFEIDIKRDEFESQETIEFSKSNLLFAYSTLNWTMSKCAQRMGKHNRYIAGYLDALETPNPNAPAHSKNPHNRRSTEVLDQEDIWRWMKKGIPVYKIAKHCNTTKRTIVKYLNAERAKQKAFEELSTKPERSQFESVD